MWRRPGPLPPALSKIFQERASFELRDEDVEAIRAQFDSAALLAAGPPDTPPASPAPTATADCEAAEAAYADWKAQYPSLLENFDAFVTAATGKRVTVFLDYDGTLTPIVKNPDRAYMSDQMREAVKAVAELFPTAIISGRGREKVESFVQLRELFYAGSHGMDIAGPALNNGKDAEALAFQPAAKFAPVMDEVFNSLQARTEQIEGASVEHNKFCVSVHFRNCAAASWGQVVAAVEAVLAAHPELKATRGRKVLEIRPQVDWDKGRALAHLLGALGLDACPDVLPIYIGDDRTDEDAFALLASRSSGLGVLVSTKVKPTEARFTLRDPSEVLAFLHRLLAWGRTPANAWLAAPACTGWALRHPAAPGGASSDCAGGGGDLGSSSQDGSSRAGAGGSRPSPGAQLSQAAALLTPFASRDRRW